ncbi:hypothetical protein DY000_02008277 [Brassica cretica]|uniref:Uncharacterized protein n=1 Tax=Brassica cretica TaxID=69181 RepID=A0ABQ7BSV2_BRACR|nr:hypothetical protein DY000_02008277 [Brassica cretica]
MSTRRYDLNVYRRYDLNVYRRYDLNVYRRYDLNIYRRYDLNVYRRYDLNVYLRYDLNFYRRYDLNFYRRYDLNIYRQYDLNVYRRYDLNVYRRHDLNVYRGYDLNVNRRYDLNRAAIWTEESTWFHKRVKRIHDPVKIVVPCTVSDTESPIPPDRSMHISSCIEGWRYHHAIRQVWGKEEEELEEEKNDQGRFSAIIDPSLLRWCQKIQSAQQMLLTTICKASSTPY